MLCLKLYPTISQRTYTLNPGRQGVGSVVVVAEILCHMIDYLVCIFMYSKGKYRESFDCLAA